MYNKVETNMNFVDREKQTEKFWEDHDIFKKSMEQGLEDHPVQEKYLKNATQIIEQLSKDE